MAVEFGSSGGLINQINQTGNNLDRVNNRLSSGERITTSADDAAGLSIATRLDTQSTGFDVAARNANDAISFSQSRSGALNSLTDDLSRIRELAVQSSNGTLNDADRSSINAEVQQRLSSVQDVLNNSSFNGKDLFSTDELQVQAGPDSGDQFTLEADDLRQQFSDIDLQDLDVSSQELSQTALDQIDQALDFVSSQQATQGAFENVLSSRIDNLAVARENSEASRSRIEDADFAKEVTERSKLQIQEQVSIAVLGQANADRGQVLSLLSNIS